MNGILRIALLFNVKVLLCCIVFLLCSGLGAADNLRLVERELVAFHNQHLSGMPDYSTPIRYPRSPDYYFAWGSLVFALGSDVAVVLTAGKSELAVRTVAHTGAAASIAMDTAKALHQATEEGQIGPAAGQYAVSRGVDYGIGMGESAVVGTRVPGIRSAIKVYGVFQSGAQEEERIRDAISSQMELESFIVHIAPETEDMLIAIRRIQDPLKRQEYENIFNAMLKRRAEISVYRQMVQDSMSGDAGLALDKAIDDAIPGRRIGSAYTANMLVVQQVRSYIQGVIDKESFERFVHAEISSRIGPMGGISVDAVRSEVRSLMKEIDRAHERLNRYGGASGSTLYASSYDDLLSFIPLDQRVHSVDPDNVTDRLAGIAVRQPGRLRELSAPLEKEIGNVVVLIHGWNPKAVSDPYAQGAWDAIVKAWGEANQELSNWRLLAYDWHVDAATGPIGVRAPRYGTDAAERAYWHGWELGALILARSHEVEKVQLIAHSAGAWAARSAALLIAKHSNAEIQVTLLDPYIPRAPASSVLNHSLMNQLDHEFVRLQGNLTRLESYHARDVTRATTARQFDWTVGTHIQVGVSYNSVRNIVQDLSVRQGLIIDAALKIHEYLEGHGMPIAWYAATMFDPHCYVSGWALSLPYSGRVVRSVSDMAVVGIVDESGSMRGRRLEMAKEGVLLLTEIVTTHGSQNEMGLVGFASAARRITPLVNYAGRDLLKQGVADLSAGGMTAIGLGIEEGIRCVLESEHSRRSLVLLSDGDHNTGDLWPHVQRAADLGIPIHAINLEAGPGAAMTLNRIADMTGGDYFDGDIANLRQVYAAIGASLGDQCVLLYKTDVIRQGQEIDYVLPLSTIMKGMGSTPLSLNLSWPGSRLGVRVLDKSGQDISSRVLTEVRRSSRHLVATLVDLIDHDYVLSVVGEQVPGNGIPFNLQVTGPISNGLFVQPMMSEYRIGDGIRLAGHVLSSGELSDIEFQVTTPSGEQRTAVVSSRGQHRRNGLWEAAFSGMVEVGIYEVSGMLRGGQVYSGSFRVGGVDEVLSRQASTLALIDHQRMLLRDYNSGHDDVSRLRHYAALTFASSFARTVAAMKPIWGEQISRWNQHSDSVRDGLKLLLPFVGQYGIASISIEQQGHIMMSSRTDLRRRSAPLPGNLLLEQIDGRYWIRLPLSGGQRQDDIYALLLEVAPVDDQAVRPVLIAYRSPGIRDQWESADAIVELDAARTQLEVIAAIERGIWERSIVRSIAETAYSSLAELYPSFYVSLVVRDYNGRVIFDAGGGVETRHSTGYSGGDDIALLITAGRNRIGQISARLINVSRSHP